MIDKQWEELNENALLTIQLFLTPQVLHEVIDKTTVAYLWLRLEQRYKTTCLSNKIHLKEQLYTIRMVKGTPIQTHLDEFNSILIDLKNLYVKIEDDSMDILLVVFLPPSYKHLKEIVLYSNNETLSFEFIKSNLLSKEKFDLEVHFDDKVKGLFMRSRSS